MLNETTDFLVVKAKREAIYFCIPYPIIGSTLNQEREIYYYITCLLINNSLDGIVDWVYFYVSLKIQMLSGFQIFLMIKSMKISN